LADNLGIANVYRVELVVVMLEIEIAFYKGWHNLGLKTNSKLVILVFSSINTVPWDLRNHWLEYMHLIRNMNFIVFHILKERNHFADKMANLGFNVQTLTWWDETPLKVMAGFARNKLGLTNFRFA